MGLSCNDERVGTMNGLKLIRNDRGVALIAVLWIFIFLFVVAFDFTSSVREEGMAAYRFAEETEEYYLAVAGFERGLYELLQQSSKAGHAGILQPIGLIDGAWRESNLGSGFYRLRLEDEGGKINLNRADEEQLQRIFTNLGIEEPRRSILVDSILDWRDPDNLHRINGAEDDYYLSLSPGYTAKNGPFDMVEELLWVRGVTPEFFYGLEDGGSVGVGLKEIFTVNSQMDRVNLRTAKAEVIHALVGIPLERSRTFVEEREKLSEKMTSDLLRLFGITAGKESISQFVVIDPSVITIEASGYHRESATQRRLKGVVRMVGGDRGFELIRWTDKDTENSYEREG